MALWGTTALALALRLTALDAESLYMDELVQVEIYALPLPQVVKMAAEMGQPPLDYLIGAVLHQLHLADSDWWVRLPAALFGSGCVFLLGWWVGRIGGPCAGVASALLLAVCPLHVFMSQEARPYTIFFFLALASTLAYAHARRRHALSAWCRFGVLFWCMLMTRWTDPHFLALGIMIYALSAWQIARRGESIADLRAETSKLCAAAGAIGAAYAVYSPFFWIVLTRSLRSVASQPSGAIRRAASHLAETFVAIFFGYSTRIVFSSLSGSAGVLIAAGVCCGVGLMVLVAKARRQHDADIATWMATMLPFPFVYALVFANLGNALPKPQYLLLGAVAVFGCMSLAADKLRRLTLRFGRVVSALAFVGVLGFFALPMARASIRSLQSVDKRDWRGVMGYLKEHSGLHDAFAVLATDTVPPTFHVAVYGGARYGREDMKFLNIDLRTSIDGLERTQWVRSDNIVWIVGYNDRMYLGYDQLPTPALSTADMRVHSFNGLFLMELPPGESAADRLMDGLESLYKQIPEGRGCVAPALYRGRYLLAEGNGEEATASFHAALKQCRSTEEADVLLRDYIAPLKQEIAIEASRGP